MLARAPSRTLGPGALTICGSTHLVPTKAPEVAGDAEGEVPIENTIEILILLREKSRGNLTPDEEKYLSAAIANLQLNYAAEKEKPQTGATEKEGVTKED